jgi:hypothetical protein
MYPVESAHFFRLIQSSPLPTARCGAREHVTVLPFRRDPIPEIQRVLKGRLDRLGCKPVRPPSKLIANFMDRVHQSNV